ncbi:MAG: anti-sigma factor family protein [Acidiferrobacterales bacterium]
MNNPTQPLNEDRIQAYVDGQLDEADRQSFEALLQQNHELAARVAAYRQQNDLLRQMFDPVLDEPVPERLALPRARKPWFSLSIAASLALVLSGGAVGWLMRGAVAPTAAEIALASLPQSARVAYVTYAPEVVHPVEVSAKQEAHLVKWLSKRLGANVRAPDLNALGFGLVGGRLLPADNGPAAQFMYEDKQGNRMTLYVRQNRDEQTNTAFRYQEQDADKTFYWVDGDLGYALTATIDKPRLMQAANRVYHALSFEGRQ